VVREKGILFCALRRDPRQVSLNGRNRKNKCLKCLKCLLR
jgi:hypothetical protein